MLERKGEVCRHKVTGYPGLLTDAEHEAYVEVVEYFKDQLKSHNEMTGAIAEIEKRIPYLKKLARTPVTQNTPTITVQGDTWRLLDTVFKKKNHVELLFCSRGPEADREFGILEKFHPDHMMELFGEKIDGFCLSAGKDLSLVLRRFLEREHYAVEVEKKRLELKIAEDVFKRHPADVCWRVCKAIAPRYDKQRAVENDNVQGPKIATGMKIGF